jgi:hypothetical protein
MMNRAGSSFMSGNASPIRFGRSHTRRGSTIASTKFELRSE